MQTVTGIDYQLQIHRHETHDRPFPLPRMNDFIFWGEADIHQDAAGAEDCCWVWGLRKHSPFEVAVRLIQ